MKILKEILYWTWCLPQTLIGLLVKLFFDAKKVGYIMDNKTYYFYAWKIYGGVSLGKYIMMYYYNKSSQLEKTLKHESGHQIQSFILGPLYLLIIGLPSITWNICFSKYRTRNKISYYSFYTEKWADKLGGIKREN